MKRRVDESSRTRHPAARGGGAHRFPPRREARPHVGSPQLLSRPAAAGERSSRAQSAPARPPPTGHSRRPASIVTPLEIQLLNTDPASGAETAQRFLSTLSLPLHSPLFLRIARASRHSSQPSLPHSATWRPAASSKTVTMSVSSRTSPTPTALLPLEPRRTSTGAPPRLQPGGRHRRELAAGFRARTVSNLDRLRFDETETERRERAGACLAPPGSCLIVRVAAVVPI